MSDAQFTLRPAPMEIWVEQKTWDSKWESSLELLGGGQASAKRVQRRGSDEFAFLKLLSRQNDQERRARFFREASAYETANHSLIPKLIESNAHRHSDLGFKMFLITEFIEGPTLSELVTSNGSISFENAAIIVRQLLSVVEYCHGSGWVHRDIKPDNIILKATSLDAPFLTDFGLSYKDQVLPDFATEHGQELGNRFLRLPELSAGSILKQDLRSDLAFVGGILFYLMTGLAPAVLVDAEGRMPHQRPNATIILRNAFAGSAHDLLGFFDKTFAVKLSERFESARNMAVKLDSLVKAHQSPTMKESGDDLETILSALKSEANIRLAKHKVLYDQAMSVIRSVQSQIAQKVAPTYQTLQSGYVNFAEGLRNTLGFSHFATQDRRFAPTFLIKIVGEEIVVEVDDRTVYRTDADSPDFGEEFRSIIRTIFVKGLRDLVELPPL